MRGRSGGDWRLLQPAAAVNAKAATVEPICSDQWFIVRSVEAAVDRLPVVAAAQVAMGLGVDRIADGVDRAVAKHHVTAGHVALPKRS